MGHYLIEASLLLALFYLVYMLLLRNGVTPKGNRVFLVLGLLIAAVFPVIPSVTVPPSGVVSSVLLEAIYSSRQVNLSPLKSSGSNSYLLWIYTAGVTWFSLRLITSFIKILFLYIRFPKKTVRGTRTVLVPGEQAPFTFFKILFITVGDLDSEPKQCVVAHEMAHIRKGHTFDVLLSEVLCVLLWFNPIIWLYKIQLKLEHEYAADAWVMKKGYNARDYQQQLFRSALGLELLPALNHFNHSFLKNRIKMIHKNKYATKLSVRYIIALTVVFALSAFTLLELDKKQSDTNGIYDTVEVMPEYPGGLSEMRVFIAGNLVYPEVAAKNSLGGKVYVQFVITEEGSIGEAKVMDTRISSAETSEAIIQEASRAMEAEALRVVKLIDGFTPGYQKGEAVKVRFTIPIVFASK